MMSGRRRRQRKRQREQFKWKAMIKINIMIIVMQFAFQLDSAPVYAGCRREWYSLVSRESHNNWMNMWSFSGIEDK